MQRGKILFRKAFLVMCPPKDQIGLYMHARHWNLYASSDNSLICYGEIIKSVQNIFSLGVKGSIVFVHILTNTLYRRQHTSFRLLCSILEISQRPLIWYQTQKSKKAPGVKNAFFQKATPTMTHLGIGKTPSPRGEVSKRVHIIRLTYAGKKYSVLWATFALWQANLQSF